MFQSQTYCTKKNLLKVNSLLSGEDHIEIIDGDLVLEPEQHRRQRRAAIDKRWPTSSNGNVYIPYVFSTSQSSGMYSLSTIQNLYLLPRVRQKKH